jgi:hypothetical protein
VSGLRGALGWGSALTVYGIVLLLRTTGVIDAGAAGWPWAALAAGVVLLAHPGARRAGSDTWPLVLTIVGGLFVLRELGGLPLGVPIVPVLLVVIGVVLLANALTTREQVVEEAVAVPLDGAARARLVLAHGAGTLRIVDGADEGLVCQGSAHGGARTETHWVGDRLEVTLRPPRDIEQLIRLRRPLDWELALARDLPLDLELRTGAGETRVDLSRTRVESLVVKTGASDVDIVAPATGRCRVRIDAGAADVDLRIPDGVAASIRARTGLASVEVDTTRFPRTGDVYRSPGFDDAEHRHEIELEGGVASFRVS